MGDYRGGGSTLKGDGGGWGLEKGVVGGFFEKYGWWEGFLGNRGGGRVTGKRGGGRVLLKGDGGRGGGKVKFWGRGSMDPPGSTLSQDRLYPCTMVRGFILLFLVYSIIYRFTEWSKSPVL